MRFRNLVMLQSEKKQHIVLGQLSKCQSRCIHLKHSSLKPAFGTVPFSVLIPRRGSLQKMPTFFIPSFMSRVKEKQSRFIDEAQEEFLCLRTNNRSSNVPLKNMWSPPGYPLGGGTLFSMWPRIDLVILSRALVPYCKRKETCNGCRQILSKDLFSYANELPWSSHKVHIKVSILH